MDIGLNAVLVSNSHFGDRWMELAIGMVEKRSRRDPRSGARDGIGDRE